MGASKKEKCFEKAVDRINEGRKAKGLDPLKVEQQQVWIKDKNGTWSPGNWTHKLANSIRKTFKIGRGEAEPRAKGAPNPVQYRVPDTTVTLDDGSKVVIDNKFDDANGNPDPWRTKPGQSGSTQKPDYEEINQQQKNDVGDPKLDKNTCECGKRKLETEKVQVKVPSMQPGNDLYFMPQGEVPPVRAPNIPPVRLPIRIPVPVIP